MKAAPKKNAPMNRTLTGVIFQGQYDCAQSGTRKHRKSHREDHEQVDEKEGA